MLHGVADHTIDARLLEDTICLANERYSYYLLNWSDIRSTEGFGPDLKLRLHRAG